MEPGLRENQQLLIDLCKIGLLAADFSSYFQQVAMAIHQRAGFSWVRLFQTPGDGSSGQGLEMEFADTSSGETPLPHPQTSTVEWVLQHRQLRQIPHGNRQEAFPEEQQLLDRGYQAIIHLPLVVREEVVGVLGLADREKQELTSESWKTLELLASLLALQMDYRAARNRVTELERFQRESAYLRSEIKTDRDLRLLTGESSGMKSVRLAVQQVARTDSTVLILGETGTGKELVARAIHQLSPRRDHLLVAVNCAALAPGIIASELFGHEPGAFTGATKRRVGRFELAHQGTLFLDEIGELSPEMQVMLLRVVQERAIERVGGNEAIRVNVRVIVATHRDLNAAVAEGRFRTDLFYRLNVFPIHVPPLRERREDIPDLVRHFVQHFGRRMNKVVTQVSPATMQLLREYSWPGNVRELENIVERAMVVATSDQLAIDKHWLMPASVSNSLAEIPAGLAEVERRAILDALEQCHGKIYGPGGAAEKLGLRPTTLYGKMRKHGIERKSQAT